MLLNIRRVLQEPFRNLQPHLCPTWKLVRFQCEMFRRALWELRSMDGMEMLKSIVRPGGSDTPPGASGVGLGPEKIQPPEFTLQAVDREARHTARATCC